MEMTYSKFTDDLGNTNEDICVEEDNFKIHRIKGIMGPQNLVSVSSTTRSRCYKVSGVCLGLLCVLLLLTIIVLHAKLTAEKDKLQVSYNNLMKEREQLQANYTSLVLERDHLQTSYNLTIQDKIKQVTEEKEKLEMSYNVTRNQLDQLQKENEGIQKRFSDYGCFRVGDRVKVKASVSTPKDGWIHKSVGVVKAINGENMTVDFPDHKSWMAAVSEMELAFSADSGYFRIGDRVRVKASVSTPEYEWGRASHRSVGVVTAINGDSMTVDFPEHKSWKAAVSEMELAPSADTENFRVGDQVRVKASVRYPKYGWGVASHRSVGVVTAVKGESMIVDYPEQKSWMAAVLEMELAPSADSENFRVGDRVRVKASVSSPTYQWEGASNWSVGMVTAVDGENMTVDFPEHQSWKAAVSEMELAPSVDSRNFRIGDEVRVKASVSSPRYLWGRASNRSVGVVTGIIDELMTVDFPEHSFWKAAVSEMELAPSFDSGNFRVGDRVRVKASISSPKYGWGDTSHSSVGVITAINGENMTVDFSEHKSWTCAVSEMELAPSTNSGNFRVGDRVRVKASVSSPKYGWGVASHRSVGVVTAISGVIMVVDFPEHNSWMATVSEMELAPSADSGNFRVGDRVRVKASVSSPKYGWERVSHGSVGVVTAFVDESMTVDFPEHKSWKAEVSEMELAPSTDSASTETSWTQSPSESLNITSVV